MNRGLVTGASLRSSVVATKKVEPLSDTYVNSQANTTNSDTAANLVTGGTTYGGSSYQRLIYMTFDVSQWAGKMIASAKLRIVFNNDGNNSGHGAGVLFRVRECLRAYDPKAITWLIYATGLSWNTNGGQGIGTDASTESYGSSPFLRSMAWADQIMDITALVQKYADSGSPLLRIQIFDGPTPAQNASNFVSKEGPVAQADYRPTLTVTA